MRTSYIDVNINIKLCFVLHRGSDAELVMTQTDDEHRGGMVSGSRR